MKVVLLLLALALLSVSASQEVRNSRAFLQGGTPFLGSYWESYLRYQTRPESCLDLTAYVPPEHADDFGYSIVNAPTEVNVVYIAFGESYGGHCSVGTVGACEPYVCGIHLYSIAGIHDDEFEELKSDIAAIQARGQMVMLAYGGEEYGNIGKEGQSHGYGDLGFLVREMSDAVKALGLDGVEIVNEEGCGSYYFTTSCGAQSTYQLYFIDL